MRMVNKDPPVIEIEDDLDIAHNPNPIAPKMAPKTAPTEVIVETVDKVPVIDPAVPVVPALLATPKPAIQVPCRSA